MKKIVLSLIVLTAFGFGATAQNVNIPDAAFKAYLVGNSAINTNSDSEIQVSEAAAFTGSIDCNGLTISDLTGLEAFTALTELYFDNNSISTIDVSQNTALVELRITQTDISTLDLSQNTALETLECGINPNLTSLNLSQCTNLQYLYCGENNLSTIDVSQNTALINFWCSQNNLNTIDVSQNTALVSFQCFNNNLSSLDVSQNPLLTSLFCLGNDLVSLDMRNIDPNLLTVFNATSNPNLTCITVDDVAAATATWTNIDAGASFSLTCVQLVTSITVLGELGASTITTQGGTLQMEAAVLPANADDATHTWSVTNGTGSASIDVNGLLTAMTDGTVTVTATANDASGVSGDAVITISNQSVGMRPLTYAPILTQYLSN